MPRKPKKPSAAKLSPPAVDEQREDENARLVDAVSNLQSFTDAVDVLIHRLAGDNAATTDQAIYINGALTALTIGVEGFLGALEVMFPEAAGEEPAVVPKICVKCKAPIPEPVLVPHVEELCRACAIAAGGDPKAYP